MSANIEIMKQPAAGADFFEIIFEGKFGLNFPPLFFTKIALKGGPEVSSNTPDSKKHVYIPLYIGNMETK